MSEHRFRIPYGRRFELPSIPIRPLPLFDYKAPAVVQPPLPRAPAGSPDYDRAVQRLRGSIRPIRVPQYVHPYVARPGWVRPKVISPGLPVGEPVVPVMNGDTVNYRPVPVRNMSAPAVTMPPVPVFRYPDVGPEDVGPVGPPAHVSLADIGPVGLPPDLPDWVYQRERAMNMPAKVNQPQMPKRMVNEGRQGVKVKPQASDYVAPPVTTPKNPVGRFDVLPAASEDEIRGMIMPTYEPGVDDRALQLKDLSMDLLKGTSKYAAGLGMTQGRTLGEGI